MYPGRDLCKLFGFHVLCGREEHKKRQGISGQRVSRISQEDCGEGHRSLGRNSCLGISAVQTVSYGISAAQHTGLISVKGLYSDHRADVIGTDIFLSGHVEIYDERRRLLKAEPSDGGKAHRYYCCAGFRNGCHRLADDIQTACCTNNRGTFGMVLNLQFSYGEGVEDIYAETYGRD